MSSLIDLAKAHLRRASVAFDADPQRGLVLRPISPVWGELVLGFDDGEITAYMGDATHCHFTPGACGDLDADDPVQECVEEAVRFVADVLADQYVIWTYPNGAGGCYPVGHAADPQVDAPLPLSGATEWLWSGGSPPPGAA